MGQVETCWRVLGQHQQEAAITRRGLSPCCFIRQHPHVFILRQHKSLVINEANESPTVAISFLV